MTEISAFGAVVREARMSTSLSVRALARQVGCSHVLLGNLERGRIAAVGERFWPSLASAVGVEVSTLRQAAAESEPITVNPWEAGRSAELIRRLARKQVSTDVYDKISRLLEDQ